MTDSGRRPIPRPEAKQLADLLRKRSGTLGLPLSADGFIAPIDANLPAESALSKDNLEALGRSVVVRFADIYAAELSRRAAALEQDRRYHAALRERLTLLLMQQEEADESEKIHDDEVKYGWYTLSHEMSKAEAAGQEAWAKAAADADKIFKDLYDSQLYHEVISRPELNAHFRGTAAMAALFSVYKKIHVTNTDNDGSSENDDFFISVADPLEYAPVIRAKRPDFPQYYQVPGWVYGSVKQGAHADLAANLASLDSQMKLATGAHTAATEQSKARNIARDWNEHDVDFRRRRTALTLTLNDMRRTAMKDGGPFDLAAEMSRVRSAWVPALADLVVRLSAVAAGYRLIWRWTLSDPPTPWNWDDTKGSYLGAVRSWITGFERMVAHYAGTETSAAIPVSVRELVGDNAWRDAIRTATTKGVLTLSFRLEPDQIPAFWGTRLRGLSVFTTGLGTDICSRGSISPPTTAYQRDASGTLQNVRQVSTACELGRVLPRATMSTPDVVGTSLLRNVVPLSGSSSDGKAAQWMAEIRVPGSAYDKLKDVQIDLLCAGHRLE